MKKQTLVAFTLAATTLMGTSAFAADGTISFTGEIKDATCDISTSSGSTAVDIPSLAKANLGSAGAVGPDKIFDIELSGSGCTGATNQVQISFENTPGTIDQNGLLVNTNPDTGDSVGLELVDSTGAAIPLNLSTYRTPPVQIVSGGTATIPLKVRYKAKASPVVAGAVASSVGVIVETF